MSGSKVGRRPNDISGKVYGNLKVIRPHDESTGKVLLWELECLVCGTRCRAQSSDLRRGRRDYCSVCRDKKSKEMPYVCLFGNYRRNAERRNIAWELSFDEFMELIHSDCVYCSRPPSQTLKKKGWRNGAIYNGIDRVDNDLDYTKENSVSCCKFCNLSKSRWSVSEFIGWLNEVKSNGDYRTILISKDECRDTVIQTLFGKNYRVIREIDYRTDRIVVFKLLD